MTKDEGRQTGDVFFFTKYEMRDTKYAFRSSGGFTLLAMVGILAVMTILAAVFAPSLVAVKDRQATDDELNNLRGIADGTELYLRGNRAWAPTLAAHSPEYVPLDSAQLLQNPRGYPRYYAAHPTTASFNNGLGLATADLTALRFLLISDLSQDAAPTITNATEFETWWATDETATPDLKIYRGNLAMLFHQVSLTFLGPGGSYQIDGTTTDSSGGTLTDYSRYHVAGSLVSLDEDTPYGTPEIEFALTTDVAYQFDPCRSAGDRWVIAPVQAAICNALWITTVGAASGVPDLSTWQPEEGIEFSDPDLSYETSDPVGTTTGSYTSAFDIGNFTASSTSVDTIHYVTIDMTIGTVLTVDVSVGDLLLSLDTDGVTLISTNSLTVNKNEGFIFRPDSAGDYSAGTFIRLINSFSVNITGGTLIETDTVVGDSTLQAGTFLYLQDNGNDIQLFTPVSVGVATVGSVVRFLRGSQVGVNTGLAGIELIETALTQGGVSLLPGQILLTTAGNENVGDNNVAVQKQDIFIFDVTNSSLDPGNDDADATLFFDGSDVALDTDNENINGLTIWVKP